MTQSPTSSISKSKRVEYIDLLRGWAVIVMIETHVFNATLADAAKSTDVFGFLKFMNGLVAPSFLFAAGLAYAVTTRRKLNDYLSFGTPLFRQFGRLSFVLALGYMLHLPKFNYRLLIHATDEHQWRVFFQADVLQCIAISLMLMQTLLLLLRNESRLYKTLIGATIALVFLTPIMWGIDFWPILPKFLAGYMNGTHFPNFPGFPLFPWSAFVFAGAITGYYYLRAKDADARDRVAKNEPVLMTRLLCVALIVIGASFLIEPLAAPLYPTYDYWKFSPSFFMLRLGLVLLLCVGMFFYERSRGVSPRSVVTLIGRESLIVYAAHLLLIYGDFPSFNFSKRINHSFGYGEAVITTIVLYVLMYLLARFWSGVKRGSLRWKITLQYGALAIVIVVFFFVPME
jgi:uncharacterized membrane protein